MKGDVETVIFGTLCPDQTIGGALIRDNTVLHARREVTGVLFLTTVV